MTLPEPWQLYPMPPEQVRAIERYIEGRAETTRQRERARLADLFEQAAAGRREYAANAPDPSREVLEQQASDLDCAARLVSGDLSVMTAWLPSWRWTAEMTEHLQ